VRALLYKKRAEGQVDASAATAKVLCKSERPAQRLSGP
jgi:hypothetical protein